MLIQILVKPNSKKEEVQKNMDGIYKVSVKAPPQEGKANEAVVKILSEYFDVPRSQINIVRGLKGKKKWVEIKGTGT